MNRRQLYQKLLEANPALISKLGRRLGKGGGWKKNLIAPSKNTMSQMRLKRDPSTGRLLGSYGRGGSDPQSLLRNYLDQAVTPMAQRTIAKAPVQSSVRPAFDIDGIRIRANTAVAQELEKAHGVRIDAENANPSKWKGHEMKPDWHDYNIFLDKRSSHKIPSNSPQVPVMDRGKPRLGSDGKPVMKGTYDYTKGFPWYAEGLWPALGRHNVPIDQNTGKALDKIHRATGAPIVNITGRPVVQPFKGKNYRLQHAAEASMKQAGGSSAYAMEHTVPVGGPDKVKQLKQLGITDYIEDYPAEWKGQQAAGLRVHTLDLPWTREAAKSNPDVIVHKDISAFADWIEKKAKETNKVKTAIAESRTSYFIPFRDRLLD